MTGGGLGMIGDGLGMTGEDDNFLVFWVLGRLVSASSIDLSYVINQ
jgi:hypothetical protein